jgi:hypothetical protein
MRTTRRFRPSPATTIAPPTSDQSGVDAPLVLVAL